MSKGFVFIKKNVKLSVPQFYLLLYTFSVISCALLSCLEAEIENQIEPECLLFCGIS